MKRRISILLTISLLMALVSPALAVSASDFTDVAPAAWYAEAVDYAVTYGMVNGTSPTTFSPNSTMIRAQFVTILGRMDGQVDGGVIDIPNYMDVHPRQYYSNHIKWAWESGVTDEQSTSFRPEDNITRSEMVIIIGKYLEYAGVTLPDEEGVPAAFADASKISAAAKPYAEVLRKCGLVVGDNNANLNPDSNMTRAEGVTVFMRLREKIGGKTSTGSTGADNASFTTNITELNISTGDWEDISDGLSYGKITVSDGNVKNMSIIPGMSYSVVSSDTSVIKVESNGNIHSAVRMRAGAAPKTATITVTSLEDGSSVVINVTVSYKAAATPEEQGYYLFDDDYIEAFAEEALRLVNELRAEMGVDSDGNVLHELEYGNERSQYWANYRSQELSIKQSHVVPEGSPFEGTSEFGDSGEGFTSENIGRIRGGASVKIVDGDTYVKNSPEELAAYFIDGWANSDGHLLTMTLYPSTKMVIGVYVHENGIHSAQWFSSQGYDW